MNDPNPKPSIPKDDFFKRLVDNLYDAVYFVDRERRIIYWNKAAEKLTGYSGPDVVGRYCADNTLRHVDEGGCQLCTGDCPLNQAMEQATPQEAEIYFRHKLGYRVPVAVRVAPIFDEQGQVVGAVEIFTDNGARKHTQEKAEQLEKLAFLDHLTQVGNRRYLESKILQHLHDYAGRGEPFGILMIDLDKFKEVNDGYGHHAGDAALQAAARTISSCLRSSDVVGRWGGDEFLAILPGVSGEQLHHLGERCRVMVRESEVLTGNHKIAITMSVGATLAEPGDSVESLIKRSDEVLYRSKEKGGNCLTMFGT
ncbi:MAG: diguanylate cyclase domain-containing protein [Terriglobales bacterium]